MCIVPKLSLIDSLFWFHLFLHYLYLVALFNLKVSYTFMFCYSMRDKLKTICYVFHIIWTHVWLSLFRCSWSFVCVLFHVITWLLSFFYQDYVFHARVLSSFDLSTQCLLRWSRLWWCMSPKKLFFCYHLPTRGRSGVKLEGFHSIENKFFPTITNKNSQDLIYEMQNNEWERLDLHTLVDRTTETFRWTWSV
jgi:hypothetical protein